MAKIEMDLSEYKLMEENKVLLKKALKREKKLSTANLLKKLKEDEFEIQP